MAEDVSLHSRCGSTRRQLSSILWTWAQIETTGEFRFRIPIQRGGWSHDTTTATHLAHREEVRGVVEAPVTCTHAHGGAGDAKRYTGSVAEGKNTMPRTKPPKPRKRNQPPHTTKEPTTKTRPTTSNDTHSTAQRHSATNNPRARPRKPPSPQEGTGSAAPRRHQTQTHDSTNTNSNSQTNTEPNQEGKQDKQRTNSQQQRKAGRVYTNMSSARRRKHFMRLRDANNSASYESPATQA